MAKKKQHGLNDSLFKPMVVAFHPTNEVDEAMLDPEKVKTLPPEWRADHERVVRAFRQAEAGEDDKARQTLQEIGLRSPYLEWKLLLRGLLAYYAREDDRARENWQRLDPKQLPARLAAPFRAIVDTEFRKLQAPTTAQVLQNQLERLQSSETRKRIQELRKGLANTRSLEAAFRAVEALLPFLREQGPHLIPRLAAHFYSSILRYGPDELPRYRRVFGVPADDREFHRLIARAMESNSDFAEANKHWAAYAKEVSSRGDLASPAQQALAQALIWQRMGNNAASIPTPEQMKKLPPMFRNLARFPRKIKPTAEECYQQSLKLAPELRKTYECLMRYLHKTGEMDKVLQAGEQLLTRFPDHLQTLEDLSDIYLSRKRYDQAKQMVERALKLQPLDRQLQEQLGTIHALLAREHVENGRFEEARTCYQESLRLSDPRGHSLAYCRWAAAELKAGNPIRSNELLVEAQSRAPGPLPVTYCLLVESNRLELNKTLKTQWTREFNRQIEEKADPGVASVLIEYAASLMANKVSYHGQQTHLKKIVSYAHRVEVSQYTEQQLLSVLRAMMVLKTQIKSLRTLFARARNLYPDNPWFCYLEVVLVMGEDMQQISGSLEVHQLLEEAERLTHKLPREEPGIVQMLDDITRRKQLLQAMDPLLGRLITMLSERENEEFD